MARCKGVSENRGENHFNRPWIGDFEGFRSGDCYGFLVSLNSTIGIAGVRSLYCTEGKGETEGGYKVKGDVEQFPFGPEEFS